jgi:hypothetical protein
MKLTKKTRAYALVLSLWARTSAAWRLLTRLPGDASPGYSNSRNTSGNSLSAIYLAIQIELIEVGAEYSSALSFQ